MKTTYLLQDGGTITATCAAHFVTQLREGSRFDYDCTDQEYMYRFADRYFDQTGHTIRADSADHFLTDLLESGYASLKK